MGLAAPQVGVNVRLMVFNPAGRRGEGEELVLANPRIVSVSKGRDLAEEGCLSFHRLGTRDLIRADVEVGRNGCIFHCSLRRFTGLPCHRVQPVNSTLLCETDNEAAKVCVMCKPCACYLIPCPS